MEPLATIWNYGTIPFVILAVIVATGPVIYMTYHSVRYGHHASPPDGTLTPASDPGKFGWTVCAHCKAVVVDLREHMVVIHQVPMPEYVAR